MSAHVELQALVYSRLVESTAVHALIKDRIYDRVPEKGFFPYVTIGPSDAFEDDAECVTGIVETFTISCWSRKQGGFKEVKQVASAVKGALHLYETDPGNSALVDLRWQITRFLRDPDGITTHAAVQFQAIMEE